MIDTPTSHAAAAAPEGVSPLDVVDVSALVAPLSDEEPCGPDLDEEGDAAFLNYLAGVEQALPSSFFTFDRAAADLPGRIAAGEALSARTRDARLLSALAKLHILNRDLPGFVRHIVALARLFETRWDALRPAPFEGDATLRLVAVQTLTDAATSVLPLEHAPVARHPRLGPIIYRAELVSSGQTPPRIDRDEFGEPVEERHPSVEDIARALREIGLDDLIATRDLLRAADAALTLMRDVTREKVGHRAALDFRDREGSLQPRVTAMALWLDHHVALRDPARALAPSPSQALPDDAPDAGALAQAPGLAAEAEGPGAAQPVATPQDAAAALAALDAYFAQREPSNPALLLVRQAAQLAGKSYLDALRTLAPDFTGAARIALGRIDGLAMQVESLADFALVEPTGEASTTIYAPASRADAVALMGAVIAYFSRNEPSSPTPLLLERAQKMCGKDFLSILREMLPPDALKV